MGKSLKILIVDDGVISAMGLEMEMRKAGYPGCAILANGEKAVEAVLKGTFDVVIMDIHLVGKINGLEAVRRICAAGLDIPVIFLTGYMDAEHRQLSEEFHPIAYMVKPVKVKELLNHLDQLSACSTNQSGLIQE
jgi:CheY-like chemotaxis protein